MSWQDAPRVTPTKQNTPKSSSWKTAPKVKAERSLLDTASEAFQNIPSSGLQFVKGMYEAVESPEAFVKTIGTALDVGAGALKQAVPAPVRNFIDRFETDPASAKRAVQTAQQAGGFYKQRYGSVEALKRTIATDPVGAAADLSALFSGGAGVVRTGGKTVSKVAPKVTQKTEQVANAMTRVAAATNPVNALAVPARVVPKVLERAPAAVQKLISPKQNTYLEAAEGRGPELIAQLRRPDLEIVPGSKPTAAQAASPLGLTKFSALGASAEKALPTPYYVRGAENEAARLESMSGVAKTPEDITTAIAARETAARPFYNEADKVLVAADKKFTSLLDRPSMDKVLARASELAAEEGVPFQIGKNRPEQNIPSKILNAEGQPMGSINIPGETAKYPGSSLHMMKMAFDDLIKNPERFGIGATEARAIGKTRGEYLAWAENKVPAYKTARTTFAEKSKPINQMEVGQYLEGKLTTPLEAGGERANVFATAVKDAPNTLRRATTNEMRFKALTDILTPEQAKIVTNIRDDLAREAKTNIQARKGASAGPRVTDMASAAQRSARPPQMLNRITTIANDIWSRLQGKIDTKLAIQIATEMLDPQTAANMLEKSIAGQTRAAKIGETGGATARATGKVLRSAPALAGERLQTATQDFPEYDPETGEPLIDIDYSEGYPVPIYGTVPRNMMRR